MANEFIHIDPGAILTKAEFELITGHQFNSQATGDILYASTSTQLSRLGIGSNTNVLEITGGVPAWVASSGTGSVARVTSPTFVTPALGTPSALVATNASGTASSLTAGTVTTNANLTGHVTSSGNAAVLGSFTSAQLATALTNETGSGLAVFGTSPTLVTPALGTPSALVATNASGTASSLTAGTVTTNANLTGVVTSSGNATAIADKALAIAKLADGTDGELITWNASGVIAAVAAGSADEVLTSNGSGAAPTFQAAGGSALQTTVRKETRTAAAATGSVSYTGAGFTPTGVLIFSYNTTDQDGFSCGFIDDAVTEQASRVFSMEDASIEMYVTPNRVTNAYSANGTDYQYSVGDSLDSDGVTLGWTKGGSGQASDLIIIYLR